ncbi:hypothetical protein TraAM80_04905 [Trypanosoma rangeli]|uniref:Transcription factor CBF/NF-Y/archaeal histone domain-containing protein n=1 Tax=Trypanosoma rangeli TaxID=5698 RepID=A0A3R7MLP0_TRYRA|nr:uncharacterized protein TraAM80_04905 [Trypanosoma rangeli]RNF04780.1 hypothetical protein TraAM80_04905 [Trypanosoma rangeli]|eukprot:RNF04780.1 hypothetical protein TraAM80_04905 [Trypanosoma rangeli]
MEGASSSGQIIVPALSVQIPKDASGTSLSTATTLKVRSLAAGQVDRIVSAALPDGMLLSKDARTALQKAATLFLFYLSCLAEDERSRDATKRVTLSAQDIRSALKAAGMAHLIPLLSTGSHMKRHRT